MSAAVAVMEEGVLAQGRMINRAGVRRLDEALHVMTRNWWEERSGPDQQAHQVLLDRALSLIVESNGRQRELGWLGRNRPLELEQLMDRTSPDHHHFWAIMMVYEHYETRVSKRVSARNERVQVTTVKGLRAAGRSLRARRRLTSDGECYVRAGRFAAC